MNQPHPRHPSPAAPDDPNFYSDNDYKIGEFDDEHDGDLIYVRWSEYHRRPYMYSYLDEPTQWVGLDWTIRQTVAIGLGMSIDYVPTVVGGILYIHREMPDENGRPTHQNIENYHEIEDILDRRWEDYTPNRILVSFSAE
jgi:hypothetical protein